MIAIDQGNRHGGPACASECCMHTLDDVGRRAFGAASKRQQCGMGGDSGIGAMAEAVDDRHYHTLTIDLLSPCVATDGLPPLRHTDPPYLKSLLLPRRIPDARQENGSLPGQGIQIELVRASFDCAEAGAGRRASGNAIDHAAFRIGHAGAAVDSQYLDPLACSDLQRTHHQQAVDGMLHQVCGGLGCDQCHLRRPRFVEAKACGKACGDASRLRCLARFVDRKSKTFLYIV